MRILHVGDIVGSPGRAIFARTVTRMRQNGDVDLIIANGENSAAGRGITPKLANELFDAGADLVTLGDHTWDQKDLAPHLHGEPRLIRPANFAPACPGRGWATIEFEGQKVTVISLLGRVFMSDIGDCPFRAIDKILKEINPQPSDIVMVEIHAEATSEKIAMGWHLDGRVTLVAGTHTHVQTSDEVILPKGTAYITDLGMTGPKESVIGCDVNAILNRFISGMPQRFETATDDVVLEGIIMEVYQSSGKAKSIERVRIKDGD